MKASLNTTIRILVALALLVVLTACPTIGPTTGTLIITITDDGSVIIAGARILLFDGTSGEVIDVLTTLATGQVEVELDPGSYQVKISAPGYPPTPPAGIAPIPLQVAAGQDLTETITLFADPNAGSTGSITGTIMAAGATGLAGVLVVAQNGPVWRATTTIDGTFVLYNIPAGTATIQGWRGGYSIPSADVIVTADTTSNQDLNAAAAPARQVTGKVSFTSTSGGVIDITLLHPGTREVIPGLRTMISAGDFTYQLSGVPDGTFEIIASLDNDSYSGSHNERFVTPACSNQPTTSPNDTVPNAAAIAESNAPLVLAPTAFTNPSILLNANSMGSKSGPYPGNNTDSHPLASIASRTSGLRCTPSRSSTTICPGLGLGARRCSRYAKTPHQPPLRSTSSRHSHPHRG